MRLLRLVNSLLDFARIEAGIGKNASAIIAAAFVILMLGAALIAFWP